VFDIDAGQGRVHDSMPTGSLRGRSNDGGPGRMYGSTHMARRFPSGG